MKVKTIVLHVKESPNKTIVKGKAYREVIVLLLKLTELSWEALAKLHMTNCLQELAFETLSQNFYNILDITTINNDYSETLVL